MKARSQTSVGDFYQIRCDLTEWEARDIRRALIFGLDVMKRQLGEGSAEFKAATYVAAERFVAELATAIDNCKVDPVPPLDVQK